MKNVANTSQLHNFIRFARNFNEDKKKKKSEERCQRIESNHTFLDLTTDSNCHRPTTSLDTVSGNLVLRAPLPLLLSTVGLPSYSLLFSFSFQSARVFVYLCTHIPSAQHRHPRYHYRHTVANCPTTPVLFLRSTPSRTRYFVTVSLSSFSFFFHLHALCYSYNTFAREYSSEMSE